MQSLKRKRDALPSDPAPSRWAWRMQRLMLTPAFWFCLRVVLPFAVAFGAAGWWLSDLDRRTAIFDKVAETRARFEARPEFMVKAMAVDGVDPEIAADIREVVPLEFPLSSFDIDTDQIRNAIAALDPVRSVSVKIRAGGILQVQVEPRIPVVVWRTHDGLKTIDVSGANVAPLDGRMSRPDLPLIAGEGANEHVKEALSLYLAAAPLGSRLRGIQRMGERRWDVVLDRDQRILLPEAGALQALERVIALHIAQDVLNRDISRVDMRLGARPTVKMNENATAEWWNIQALSDQ